MKKKPLQQILTILFQICSVGLLAIFVRGLSWSDLYVLQMSGDGLTNYSTAKGFVEGLNGSVNPSIGAPHGLSVFATPSLDLIYLCILWIVSTITQNGIFAVNFIFYLGFGLAFSSSYWVLSKRLSPRFLNSILSLSFAFIPEHWARQSHTALSMYWTIPLSIYYIILLGNNVFEKKYSKLKTGKQKLFEIIKILGILTFLTFQGTYYSFFTIYFTGIVLLLMSIASKKLYKVSSLMFLGQVIYFLGASSLTAKIATLQGTNLGIFQRTTWESILYGGHLPFIFMPWPGSGIPGTSRIHAVLENAYPGGNEFKIWSAFLISLLSIAIVASAFLHVTIGKKPSSKNTVELQIYQMFFAGILLYLSGGIGFLIAIIEPQLRAWNRVNFFLAFLAILWLVEQVPKLVSKRNSIPLLAKNSEFVTPVTYFLLLSILFVDQFPIGLKIPPGTYQQNQEEIKNFSAIVNNYLPDDCIVMQIPPAKFPEMPPIEKMADYDLFYPYLFTRNVRFTYGSIKGSQNSSWQELLPKKYSQNFIRLIAANGFCSLMWDRNGLTTEEYVELENALNYMGLRPYFSKSERWGFVSLGPVKSQLSGVQVFDLRNDLLDAQFVHFDSGFSFWEKGPNGDFIWAIKNQAVIKIVNPSDRIIREKVKFEIRTSPTGKPRNLKIENPESVRTFKLNQDNYPIYNEVIVIPANSYTEIQISVSGRSDKVSSDPRNFYFQLLPLNKFIAPLN